MNKTLILLPLSALVLSSCDMMIGVAGSSVLYFDRLLSSTPFLSAGDLEDMSEESKVSAYDALVKAVDYALKEKPSMLSGVHFSIIDHCLGFKEGPYKDYYFFPSARRSKADVIAGKYPLSGIYVHSQTGELSYIDRSAENPEMAKVDKDDYEDIYNMRAVDVVYEKRVDLDDMPDAQAHEASRMLRSYLAKTYPKIKKGELNEVICYVRGSKYFFPFENYGRSELGFSIDVKEYTVTLVIRPLHHITW